MGPYVTLVSAGRTRRKRSNRNTYLLVVQGLLWQARRITDNVQDSSTIIYVNYEWNDASDAVHCVNYVRFNQVIVAKWCVEKRRL